MDDDLEEFARVHRLGPAAAAELGDLVRRREAASRNVPSTRSIDGPDDPAARHPLVPGHDRYEDLGLIGVGAQGEVRRVHDRVLDRVLAMKVIRADLAARPASVARFNEEARVGAQLQHPGLVPVHDLGVLPDGRPWFTMTEIRGRPLTDPVAEVHHASSGEAWVAAPSGWTLRRLVDAFGRVCDAVAYAHARGVVHRDLKPSNVMVGDHGEVLVVDWGLAKVVGADPGEDEVRSSRDDADRTRVGRVTGTAAYMPPEQARGRGDLVDRRSDVYALGAVLYEILSGRPPYEGRDAGAVIRQVLGGPPPPPGRWTVGSDGATVSLDPDSDLPDGPSGRGPPLPRSSSPCASAR